MSISNDLFVVINVMESGQEAIGNEDVNYRVTMLGVVVSSL